MKQKNKRGNRWYKIFAGYRGDCLVNFHVRDMEKYTLTLKIQIRKKSTWPMLNSRSEKDIGSENWELHPNK